MGLSFNNNNQTSHGPWYRQGHTSSQMQIPVRCHRAGALAISWAVTKCKIFLAGLPHFKVISSSSHHPLILILNSHRLDEIKNPRLQCLKSHLMGYNFTAEWRKGKSNSAPDALSQHPVPEPLPQDTHTENNIRGEHGPTIAELRIAASGGQENRHIQEVRKCAQQDMVYQLTSEGANHVRISRLLQPNARRVQKILEYKRAPHSR